MMIKTKVLTALTALFLLGGCAADDGFNPKSTVRVVNSMSYPEFPNVQPVFPVNLIPWQADVPRDMTKTVVKNLTSCKKVPEEDRDDAFWNRCGEHPIVTNSNIFIGFDQTNWNIIIENFAKLREQLFKYQKRVEEVNRQREAWRVKAEAERQRMTAENSGEPLTEEEQENLIDKIKKRLEGINRNVKTDDTVERLDDILEGRYYAVQFGSYKVQENAYRGLEQFKQKAPIIFKELNVEVKRIDNPTKGIQYGLRTDPIIGRIASNAFCKSLREKNIDCYVLQVNYSSIGDYISDNIVAGD